MIVSLVYASRSVVECDDARFAPNIMAIRECTELQNILTGITGFLFYFDNKFVQMIEGDFDNVADLYKRIRRDERHDACRIIEFREIDHRNFEEHAMENSMDFIVRNHAELHVKMGFLNKFIGESVPGAIRLSDLLYSVAQEIQMKPSFPRLPTAGRLLAGETAPLI